MIVGKEVDPIKSLIKELLDTKQAYTQRMYPDFVIKKSTIENEIPVFVYHRIRGNELESHLRHLIRNDYITITCDQFYDYLFERKKLLEKSVLLTFDDGFDDLYRIVYPLLRRYGFKAVVYLITGWVGKDGMLTWQQISEMHSSGLFDFQSHSVNHMSIFMSSNIVGFCTPDNLEGRDWNFPVINTINSNNSNMSLGYPIFVSTSRFSDHRRFYPRREIVTWFTSFVQKCGGREFFKKKKWKKIMLLHEKKIRKDISWGHYESKVEQCEAIKYELQQSKREIESRLPDKTVKHFAYPWFENGRIAERILKEYGYLTAAVGLSKNKNSNTVSINPLCIVRVSGDFVMALPGDGRKTFLSIMFSKMVRRLFWGVTY